MLEPLHRGYFTSGSENRYLTGRFKYETNFLKSIIKPPSKHFFDHFDLDFAATTAISSGPEQFRLNFRGK